MLHHHGVIAETRKPVRPFLNPGVALLFAGALYMTAHAAAPAHPATPALPLLRLDYYATGPNWNLDPVQANVGEAEINALVRANLVRILPDDTPVSDLATWTVSKDHLVYTFTIRSAARFSNGHPGAQPVLLWPQAPHPDRAPAIFRG
jgi:ABC-type transport system substrate-binding protein